jgi:hypothetical protein
LEVATSNFGTKRNLYTADNITGMPAASNVKTGVTYGPVGELTGTFDFVQSPSAADIQAAVWSATTRTITGGLVDTATTLTNAPTVPTPSQIASQVRTELSTELSRLDVATSTRSTLTSGDLPSVPSAASNASAVRTELTTELARIDQNISSRLASADYTTPPTTAQIASAVEGSLLNEADGQQVLNAIVGAIGNQNVDEIALVAAIRSDLERAGGKLDSIPTDAAQSAASVATAVWSASTKEITGGTVTTLTNSPDVPTEAEIAAQVRTELSVELGRIDAAVSSRLAPSGTLATVTTLTNAPTVPTAAAIADEVRVELATELARLDAPVSGATAPSAATVATAVRSELATELARVDQAISTRLADADYVAPANSDITTIKAKTDALNTERLANVATTAIVGNLLAQANS